MRRRALRPPPTPQTRIIAQTGKESFGNYKKFVGEGAHAKAEEWSGTEPVVLRRKVSFLGKVMVLNGLLIALLYYAHWGITKLYHSRCLHSPGSPECKFLHQVQGAVVTGYENIYVAIATFVATGVLSLVTQVVAMLN